MERGKCKKEGKPREIKWKWNREKSQIKKTKRKKEREDKKNKKTKETMNLNKWE